MGKRKSLAVVFILILVLAVSAYISALDIPGWLGPTPGAEYTYNVQIDGLLGRSASGETTIMVPIPATKNGIFVTTPSKFDNISVGIWTTFIAETDDGHMMGFKTNESILEDIYFSTDAAMDSIDIFDPIHQNAPILYPATEFSEISMKPYGNQERYSSNPTYISYVYISDNIEEGNTNFYIIIDAKNANGPKEYLGFYLNYVGIENTGTSTNNTGKMRVKVNLEQTIPHGYGIRPYPKWVQEYE